MMLACPQGKVGLGLMSAAFSPVDDAKLRAFGLLPQYPICGILVPNILFRSIIRCGIRQQPPEESGFLRRLYVGRMLTDLGA